MCHRARLRAGISRSVNGGKTLRHNCPLKTQPQASAGRRDGYIKCKLHICYSVSYGE